MMRIRRNKNVAIMSYALTNGGAERIAGLLSVYLSKIYNVYLFVQNTEIITYKYGGTLLNISENGEDKIEETIIDYKRKYRIDVSISFLIAMNCLNIRTRVGDSVVISARCSFGEVKPYPFVDEFRIKTWYGDADAIVACAEGCKYDLVHNYSIDRASIKTIYNFIDKDRIYEQSLEDADREIKEFVGNNKLLINVGRLDRQKNHTKLLMQFKKIVQQQEDVSLIIVGSGDMKDDLKRFAAKLEIEDKVLFVNYSSNPFPLYRMADIMVFSSDNEGLPNVVLEAMVLGLPVVAVDCLSGPLELIKGSGDYSNRIKGIEICERGILVEKCDSDTLGTTSYLAEAVLRLLDDSALSCSISENELEFMKSYDNDAVLKEWISVIENVRPKESFCKRNLLAGMELFSKVFVYGAGIYGKTVMRYILGQKPDLEILGFAVSSKAENPDSIYGIPVFSIDDIEKYKNECIVIIGVAAKYDIEVKNILDKRGFNYMYSDV